MENNKMEIMEKARYWAENSFFDDKTKAEARELINSNDEKEIIDRFYQDLEFGTGGLRGIIGAGTNRMNIYTVRRATFGFANYLKRRFSDKETIKVVIAFDNRRKSDCFSREAAMVFAAMGIKTFLFPELAPTPILSFSVRYFQAQGGIMMTASHNPKEYNGYKAYWDDGGQVVPPHDKGIIDEVLKITDYSTIPVMDYDKAIAEGLIEITGDEVLDDYFAKVAALRFREHFDKSLRIVYTPLHGTGAKPVTRALKERGFENIITVTEQMKADPDFSTVASPNPENQEAMELAEKYAVENQGEIICATDPDSDRMGAAILHEGEYVYLNGNQMSALLAYYIFSSLKDAGKVPENPVLVKTIVTSDLQNKIAEAFGAEYVETLTGFKWIAEQERFLEKEGRKRFVFGSEESYGFLAGDFVRDKDGVIAVSILAEMAAYYKTLGKTVVDVLNDIYKEFGFYLESLININFKGVEGKNKMKGIMENLRGNPPREINGSKVVVLNDYQKSESLNLENNEKSSLPQPKSNVLSFIFEDGSKISARPSGTEPKIKFYFSVNIDEDLNMEEKSRKARNKLKVLEKEWIRFLDIKKNG